MIIKEKGSKIAKYLASLPRKYTYEFTVFVVSSLIFRIISTIIIYKTLYWSEPELNQTSSNDNALVLTVTPIPPSPTKAKTQTSDQGDQLLGVSDKVNINTATMTELDSLPGIGPVYAQRIIESRPYTQKSHIVRVVGIGQKTYEKIKDLITTE